MKRTVRGYTVKWPAVRGVMGAYSCGKHSTMPSDLVLWVVNGEPCQVPENHEDPFQGTCWGYNVESGLQDCCPDYPMCVHAWCEQCQRWQRLDGEQDYFTGPRWARHGTGCDSTGPA